MQSRNGKGTMSEITRATGQTVIKPNTDIIAPMVAEFKAELRSLVSEGAKDLVIDLTGVEMIDSLGLGALIATHNTLEKAGGKLSIINASKDISGVFKTMRLDKHFNMGN
jgi:anti-anti-sigma factor